VKEGDVLLVLTRRTQWLLVQSQAEGGKAGFVPENYVEVRYATYNFADRNTEQLLRRPLPMTERKNRPWPGGIVFRHQYVTVHPISHRGIHSPVAPAACEHIRGPC